MVPSTLRRLDHYTKNTPFDFIIPEHDRDASRLFGFTVGFIPGLCLAAYQFSQAKENEYFLTAVLLTNAVSLANEIYRYGKNKVLERRQQDSVEKSKNVVFVDFRA
jgi:hypothetical protein